MSLLFVNETFERNDFCSNSFLKGEYELCNFINCEFNEVDLSEVNFIDCEFNSCNISLAKIHKTSFQNIKFKNCKMLGLNFSKCNEFGFSVNFENCLLDQSSFYNVDLRNTCFSKTKLHDVDFTEANLKKSKFYDSDLLNASFYNTNLEEVNFKEAFNYNIDPELNSIIKAEFSLNGIKGILEKYQLIIE